MLLTSATTMSGELADVRVTDGAIETVARDGRLSPRPDEPVHDLSGRLLVPSLVEPHAHLDKALTSHLVHNPTGDLLGAIDAWYQHRQSLSTADIAGRARQAALAGVARGVTALRTHVDIGPGIELRGIEAVTAVRDELAHLVDIEIVALTSTPATGRAGADNRALLRAALDAGADLVGGAPHVDPEPITCIEWLVETAAAFDRGLDLHMDETLDPGHLGLATLAELVGDFEHLVTASHCVSLGVQPPDVQERVADAVAAAGVSVVALPQTNLYLQARGLGTAPPRGLTAIAALRRAGVNVATGGDNIRDPFNPLGRADPLEAAGLLVAAGHVDPGDAFHSVTDSCRSAMGRPTVALTPGSPADLVAIRAASVDEAIATGTEDRIVFRAGRVVARTTVSTTLGWPTALPA